jgi:membrane protease YdiL (CAAX protease family)
MGLKWHNKWAASLLVLFLSATWITMLVVRAGGLNPIDLMSLMMSDLQGLGPFAFILDFIVLGLIILWWRKKKAKKQEPKWESAFPSE